MRMLVLFAVLASVLLPAPAVPPVGRPSAHIETWAAKTYPFSDPDPVPCVGAKRYPYCRFDGSTDAGVTQDWQTVVLENGRIRVKLVPAIGGKVWGATDLRTGTDFIYDNHVVKFRDVAARGPWTSGGIEFNFGIIGHAPSCSTPVDWFVRTNADESVSYFVASDEYITRSRWQVEVRLRPDAEEFETQTTWYNASGLPQPYYHWMNAAYSVRGNPRFLFPGSQYVGHDGDAHPWPVDEKGRDISVFEGNAFGGPKSYHILPGANEFYGIWWPGKSVGAYHRSEACEKYGRKIWLWALSRAGGIWEDLLTDTDGQYTELQSGRCFQQPQKKCVETPFDHPLFMPGSTERFVERWGVLRKEGLGGLEGLEGSGPTGRPVISPADFDRESARGLYLRGRHCFSDRDNSYAEAEAYFRQSLAKDTYFRPSLVALAALENRRGDYAACHRLCEKVLSLDTYDTDANYLDGFAWFAEGDNVNARDRLGVAAFDNRNRSSAYALIARTFLREGRADKALVFADKSLSANAANLDALLVKAIALHGTDAFKPFADAVLADYPLFHAVRYLRDGESFRTLVRNELPEQTYLELGSWFEESGLKDEARRLFAFAASDPIAVIRRAYMDGDVSALSAVARLPAAGVFPFRRESLPALCWAAEKGGWKCRYHYAVELAALDRKDEANVLFDTLDEADEAVVFLLRAMRREGAARLADLRRAQALGGGWRTGRALCDFYEKAGDATAFLREAESWLGKYPKINAIQTAYAKALHQNGRDRECLDYLKDVVFLPSELRGNVSEVWRAAQKALGLEITYPENLGTGKPFPEEDALPTGCPDFVIDAPRSSSGPVVRAADFGVAEANERNAEAANRAFAEACRVGAGRVVFEPGTYRCFDGQGIVISNLTDCIVDFGGATFVFRRTMPNQTDPSELLDGYGNVEISGCLRTEVGNLNVDWDWERDPLAVWCTCIGAEEGESDDSSYGDFELERPHPKYPQPVPVQILTPMEKDGNRPRMSGNMMTMFFGTCAGTMGTKSEWLSPTRLRIYPFVRPSVGYVADYSTNRLNAAANRTAVRRWKAEEIGQRFTVSHHYYGMNGIVMTSNRHFTLRNVEIWATRGMGVETRGAQKFWQLIDVNSRPKPGSGYPVSSTADAHHVVQSQGFAKMIGCETALHRDDFFNYHDRTQIAWKKGPRTVEVVNNRGIAYTRFRVGSLLRLRQQDFSDTCWTGRIIGIDGERISFDRDLPRQTGLFFVLVDAEYATENFLFRNCRFHDSPGRGLVLGNNITFENCTFGPLNNSALQFQSCYSYNAWCEGIGCTNVVVRNCRFENVLGKSQGVPIFTALRLPWKGDQPLPHLKIAHPEFARTVAEYEAKGVPVTPSGDAIGRILIEGCTFVNPRGPLWRIMNGHGFWFCDNKVVWDDPADARSPHAGKIRVDSATGVHVPAGFLDSLYDKSVEKER